jgi:hypothetical protein
MCKTKTLFSKIVLPFLPEFESISNIVKNTPNVINIEHLIELAMARVGGYDFIDAPHCDFSDMSESKTASVLPSPVSMSAIFTYPLYITNVVSAAGQKKIGLIRAVVYNPHVSYEDSVNYFCIPSEDLDTKLAISYNQKGIGNLKATWYKYTNKIQKLEKYRVPDFVTLAQIKNV